MSYAVRSLAKLINLAYDESRAGALVVRQHDLLL